MHAFIASVDYETDRKIQDTIAYEFKDRTILCIARAYPSAYTHDPHSHPMFPDRLRTIIGYDRICVLDAGQIAVRSPAYFCPARCGKGKGDMPAAVPTLRPVCAVRLLTYLLTYVLSPM